MLVHKIEVGNGDSVEVVAIGEYFEYRIITARYAECVSDNEFHAAWVALMEGLNKYNSAFA